jgi:hypothetical protein
MLQRVAIEGLELPRLYIAENDDDVQLAVANGIPFVRWKLGQEKLVKMLLRPTLEKMFPGINWNKVLGKPKVVRTDVQLFGGMSSDASVHAADIDMDAMRKSQYAYDHVVDSLDHEGDGPNEDGEYVRMADMPTDIRDFSGVDNSGMGYDAYATNMLRIEDYVGDLSSCVDIDVLQRLGCLPKFVGDITDCIRHNLSERVRWTEGYTKKLGYPLGKFTCKQELPNLLIIDISNSIPDGIAATMLTLADTLRAQLNADLIITSRRSGYYPAGSELPSPQTLRDYYGRSNESAEFMGILEKHIAGREFGHVISFGDYDCPGTIGSWKIPMANTKVHEVHHYHTRSRQSTGYAMWVAEICPGVVQHFDTSWCSVINKRYKMPGGRSW